MAHAVRQTIVSRLGRSLGRAVALGEVGGNLTRGIELRNLVVAERGGFSHGVAFSADRVHLTFRLWDLLWDLARRPRDVLGSIARADLVTPHVEIARDARGNWNLTDLLRRTQGPLGPAFHGQITVRHGVIGYADSWGVESPPFATRFEGIEGTVGFGAAGQVDVALRGRSTAGEQATARGRYFGSGGTYDFDVTVDHGSARHWGGYLVRLGALRWLGGRFGGHVHLFATQSVIGVNLDYTATIRLDDGEALYRPAGVPLRHVNGEMHLDSGQVSTGGMTLVAGDSPVWLRGDVAYAGVPWLDLVVRPQRLDLGRARAVFFPGTGLTLTGRATGAMWISGPLNALSFSGTVAAADGRLNRQDFSGLTTRFDYNAGVLAFRDLSAAVGAGQVAGDAVIDLAPAQPSYTFAATAHNLDVAALPRAGLSVTDGVAGRGSGTVLGVGSGSHAQVLGDLALGHGIAHGQTFDALRTAFWDDDGLLGIDQLDARVGQATIYASGGVGRDGALDLEAEGHNVPLAAVAAWTPVRPSELTGVADFHGHIGGSLASPALSGDITAWDGRLGPMPYAFARGALSVSASALSIPGLDLFEGGAHYGVAGAVSLRPLSARNLTVEGDGVPAGSFLHDAAGINTVTGTLSGQVRVNGPLDRPSVAGIVALTKGSVLGQRVDGAVADLSGAGGQIQISRLDARASGSSVHASGTVDLRGPLNLTVEAERVRLADVSALSRLGVLPYGTVTVNGRVIGTLVDPEFQGRFVSPDLWTRGQAFSASGVADYRAGQLRFAPLDVVQGDSRYGLTGSFSLAGRPAADIDLHVTHGKIATLAEAADLRLPVRIDGVIDGDVALSGPLSDPSASLQLALHDARVGGVPAGTGTADLAMRHGAIDVRRFELHPGRGRLAAQGQVRFGGTSSVEVSATDLDPAILVPIFHLQQPLRGNADFTLQWSGPPGNPTAGLSLDATGVGIGGVTMDRITALAYYKGGTITIQDGRIAKGTHTLVVGGTLPTLPGRFALDPAGPLHLGLHLQDADLSFLSLLTPAIQDASGTVAGEVDVGGTVAEPTMSGFVRTSGGRLRYAPLRTPIEDIAADITFSRDQIEVHNVSADIGGGHAATRGTVAVSDLRPESVDLSLEAKHVGLDMHGVYTGAVDADLALRGPARTPRLSGTVILSAGHITYAGAAPASVNATLPHVGLDVTVKTGTNLVYGVGPVEVPLVGSVHVAGTAAQPKLSGEVQADGGSISLLGTPFTVLQGRATFSEGLGLTPLVTARAQGQIGDTRIFLDVSGLLPNPSIVWSSEPPMSQSDILSLVFGAPGAPGNPTGLASAEIGRLVLGSVTQTIQRALHLDELSVSYSTQNQVTLRVGKFVSAKFYLTLSEVFAPSSPGTTTTLVPGTFARPALAGQSYTVVGLEYLMSPSVSFSYDVDTLGDNGFFLLTSFPF